MRFLRRNVLGLYAVYAVAIVSGLVVTPIVIHSVGTEGFGVWSFIGSITIYLSILDFGVGPTVVRFAAEAGGRGSDEDLNSVASTGFATYLAIGVATVPVGIVIAWFSPDLVSAPADLVWSTRVATLLVVAGLALRFPLGLFNNLLVARQRWDLQNMSTVVSAGLYALLVALLLPRWESIVLLAALSLGSTLIRLVLPLFWLRSEFPRLRLQRRLVTRERLRGLASFSWSNFLVHVANKVVFSTDIVVVGIVLGAVASGHYAISAKLFGLAFGIGTAATTLLFPAFAELEGLGDHGRQQRLLASGLRFGMALMLLLALPLLLIPDELIHAWIGSGYGSATAPMAVLAVVLIVHQPIFLFTQFLIARGVHRELAVVLVGVTIANLVLSVVLAWQVGIWGVAASTLVTDVALLVYVLLRYARSAALMSVGSVLGALFKPLLPAAIAAVLVLVVGARLLYEGDTLLELLPVGIVWVVVASAAIWRFGLGGGERELLRGQLHIHPNAASVSEPI